MNFTLLFIYFIKVNKYRFCLSVIGYINIQIFGIGYKKIYIGRSLVIIIIVVVIVILLLFIYFKLDLKYLIYSEKYIMFFL